MNQQEGPYLLDVRELTTSFRRGGLLARRVQERRAVDRVSFRLHDGESFALVGESGCGKTTLARTLLALIPAAGGEIWFDGRNVLSMNRRELRAYRRQVQMVFQDPAGSLNPRLRVADLVAEPLNIHRLAGRRDRRRRAGEVMEWVGLGGSFLNRYPHELSGGQRQRVVMARALMLRPRLLICDEPVSALDVSIQAEVLNLLDDLRRTLALTFLLIAHNLALVRHLCRTVAVMHRGHIVEMGPTEDVFRRPRHPYTLALLESVPVPDPGHRVERAPPAEAGLGQPAPSGCLYRGLCPLADLRCEQEEPGLAPAPGGSPAHRAACHHADLVAEPTRLALARP